MLILNLSLSELIWSMLEISKIAVKWYYGKHNTVTKHIDILELTGVTLVYFVSMIYITLDRFFKFYLNMKYKSIITRRRTIQVCIVTWILSSSSAICVVVLNNYNYKYKQIFYIFVYPIVEALFLLSAGVTYGYIIYIYQNQRKPSPENSAPLTHVSGRRKLKIYIPTLLVLTFLIFMIIPDIIYLVCIVVPDKEGSMVFLVTIWMLYMISLTCDAAIYIFLQRVVRQELCNRVVATWYLVFKRGDMTFSQWLFHIERGQNSVHTNHTNLSRKTKKIPDSANQMPLV